MVDDIYDIDDIELLQSISYAAINPYLWLDTVPPSGGNNVTVMQEQIIEYSFLVYQYLLGRRFGRYGDCETLNIFVLSEAALIDVADWVLGQANFPYYCEETEVNFVGDNVIILSNTLPGDPDDLYPQFSSGDTMTHEVGHWLGLYHTFTGGCSEFGDEMVDTPREKDASIGCPLTKDTCPYSPGLDPIHNIME